MLDPAYVQAAWMAARHVGGDGLNQILGSGFVGAEQAVPLPEPLPELALLSQNEAMAHAIAQGVCKPPMCGGSLAPWAPLIVPPKLDTRTLVILLNALVALDENYLREHPSTPRLYRAGIRYEQEPLGHEQWLTIPWCLLRRDMGRGCDCEDLSAWRCAELRVFDGEPATPVITARTMPSGKSIYHIRVRRSPKTGAGRIEDPSAVLGMWTPDAQARYGETHSIVDGDKRT